MNNVIFISGLYSQLISATMRPISSYQLAWWLRKHNIESQVIEFTQLMSSEQLVRLIEQCMDSSTHSICVSTVFWPMNPTVIPEPIKSTLEIIKKKYPNLSIVAGGPNVHRFDPSNTIFDVKITGDGEDKLLSYCQEKKYKLTLPNQKFDIVHDEHRYSEKDLILSHEAVPMELGRGCIFKCKFCSSANIGKAKGTYQRGYDYIFDEIKYNYEKFGTTHYMFLDDTVNEDEEKINYIANISKRLGVQITWSGYIRVDLIWSKKNYNELFDSGLRNAYFGLESFHPEASKIIGKGWNGQHGKEWIPKLYNELWNKQVKIEASFIVGLPKETEESLLETVKWINEINAGYMFFYPLDLKNDTTNSELSSVFSRDYPKYNYIINNGNQWYNTETKIGRPKAEALASKLNKMLFNHTMGGWNSNHLYNIGMSLDEIRNTKLIDLGHILAREKSNFINKYVGKFNTIYPHKM